MADLARLKERLNHRMCEIASDALKVDFFADVEDIASAKYRIDGMKEALKIVEEFEEEEKYEQQ